MSVDFNKILEKLTELIQGTNVVLYMLFKTYYEDISSYLPNDGHAYEVIADAYCQSSAKSGAICEVYLNGHGQSLMVARNTTRTNSLVDNEATVILPIAKGKRTLEISTGQSGTASIRVTFHAYRRLGTNS